MSITNNKDIDNSIIYYCDLHSILSLSSINKNYNTFTKQQKLYNEMIRLLHYDTSDIINKFRKINIYHCIKKINIDAYFQLRAKIVGSIELLNYFWNKGQLTSDYIRDAM